MSRPKRVSPRDSATNPQPMNDHATSRPVAAARAGFVSWLLVNVSASPAALNATPTRRITHRRRSIALSKHSFERSAGELGLRNEAAGAAPRHERAEVGAVAARGQDDLRTAPVSARQP